MYFKVNYISQIDMQLIIKRVDREGSGEKKVSHDQLTLSQQEVFRTIVKIDPSAKPLSSSVIYETPYYAVEFDEKVVCDQWSSNGIWIMAFVNDVLG